MTFSSGVKLGAYEIVGPLGAGGMGEVYRARDSKLKREVAIKVLPDGFSRDAERVSRFQREAEVLASLNHPHIAAIYDLANFDESRFLVLELVEGETLADRIARGPISIDESLPIANQIASALEAAHDKGIIHRDLKPANIKVRPDGMVKVLDFGLAKVFEETSHADDLTESPTMVSSVPSSEGVILGTAAYMSPEQARGKPVDKRTDIWAFGCVLYEMLSGRKPFDGETLTDVVAAVVKNEPDWKTLPPATPVIIRSLLGRCLRKDPGQRLHDIADARIEIQEAISGPAIVPAGVTAGVTDVRRGRRLARALPWALAAAMAILLLILLATPQREDLPNPLVTRVDLSLPPGVDLYVNTARSAVLSPDGRRWAFVGIVNGRRQLYVRSLDQFDAIPIQGTDLASTCSFSPNGSEVAFGLTNRTLKKVSLADGLVTTLGRDVDFSAGIAWGADGRITFSRSDTLWQVPANGGSPQQLTTLDKGKHEILQAWPTVVAGGKTILFTSVTGSGRDDANIESLSIATGERRVIVESGSFPIYSSSGHLIFFRGGSLLAVPFDIDRLELAGPSVRVVDNLAVDSTGTPLVDVSSSGSLIYPPGNIFTGRLAWVSRQGVEEPINDTPRNYANPRLAPDGRRLAVQAAGDLWVQDTARATFTLLTSADTVGNSYPVWTPHGKRVVFRTRTGLRWVDADSSGRSQGIAGTSSQDYPNSVLLDNETLVVTRIVSDTSGDVYLLSGGNKPEAHPLVQSTAYEGGATFSPDRRWMAYASDESGQLQVYVRPFPTPDRTLPVSTDGGTAPVWNPRGGELFYRNGNKLMVVDVSTSPELTLSRPRLVFEKRYSFGGNISVPNYDVSPDGQRFVMIKDESGSGRLNLVLDWIEELKRLVPAR